MIELYTYPTPNGRKPAIMLAEVGLPYSLKRIDLSNKEQFDPDFVAISPNSKIPAIIDTDNSITLFESGAILIYLAEKTGQLLPQAPSPQRYITLQWLMFQMGNVGPMFGQLGHFRHGAPTTVDYGINRYEAETKRLLAVMDGHLMHHEYLAGNDYSIADISTYPWVAIYNHLGVPIDPYPQVQRWLSTLAQRPAVQTGMAIMQSA
jgi:GST-like protein